MPAIYTHYNFAVDVKNKTEENIREIINNQLTYYIIFSQSFDNLYYYNFLNFKKGSEIRKLGTYCHTHKIKEYFTNIIKYIKENELEKNAEVLVYLFGAINHYVSDSMLHPYINYRTGRYAKTRHNETKKYIGKHTDTELRIDAYYYEKNNNKPFKKYKIYKDIPKLKFSETLVNTIDYTFKETFKKENMGKIFNKSYNQSKNVYRILMYDPYGIKTFCYKVFDKIIPNMTKKAASFSLYKDPIEETFFNKKHNTWCNPVDKDLLYEHSWEDFYKNAINKARKLIRMAYQLLNDELEEEVFFTELGNNSYTTGFDINDKRITQYYEY